MPFLGKQYKFTHFATVSNLPIARKRGHIYKELKSHYPQAYPMVFLFQSYSRKRQGEGASVSPTALIKSISAQIEADEKLLFDYYQNYSLRTPDAISELSKKMENLYETLALLRNSSDFSSLSKNDYALVLRGLAFCHEIIPRVRMAYEESGIKGDETEMDKLDAIWREIESTFPTGTITKFDAKKLSSDATQYGFTEMAAKPSSSEQQNYSDYASHYLRFSSLLEYAYVKDAQGGLHFALDSLDTLNYITDALDKAQKTGSSNLTIAYLPSQEAAGLFMQYLQQVPYMDFGRKGTVLKIWQPGTLNAVMMVCDYDETRDEKYLGPAIYPLPEEKPPEQHEPNIFVKKYESIEERTSKMKNQPTDMPVEQMKAEKENSDNSNRADLGYGSFDRFEYGRNYVGKNVPTLEEAMAHSRVILHTLALDLGYNPDATDAATKKRKYDSLEDFLASKDGLAFLSDLKTKLLTVEGRATLEKWTDAAYNKNSSLATERAGILLDAINEIISDALYDSSKTKKENAEFISRYTLEAQTKGTVVVPWGEEGRATLTKYMNFLWNTGNEEGSGEYLSATEQERGYARKLYDILTGSAITKSQDESGNAYYYVSNYDQAKKFWSRMPSDPTTKGEKSDPQGLRYEGDVPTTETERMGKFFVKMLEYGFSRGAGVACDMDVQIKLHIDSPDKTEPGKETKVNFTVGYNVDGADREYLSSSNGRLRVYLKLSDGTVRELEDNEITYDSEKKVYTATFISPDKDFVIAADANRQELHSGWVWKTVAAEKKKLSYNYPLIVVGDEKAMAGDTVPLQVDVSKINIKFDKNLNEITTQTPADALLAFGLTVGGSSIAKYFFTPDENVDVRRVDAYNLGVESIAVDRDLYYDGALKYTKEQLIKMLKDGVVAISVGEGSKKRWFTLDGRFKIDETNEGKFYIARTKIELPGLFVDGDKIKSSSKSYYRSDAVITSQERNDIPANEDIETVYRLLTPKALVLPPKTQENVKMGGETYSRDDLVKFAKEGVIAFVEDETYTLEGKKYNIVTVYLINGQKVGPLSNVLAGIAWFPGLLSFHKTSGSITSTVQVHVPDIEGISGDKPDNVICYGRTKDKGTVER